MTRFTDNALNRRDVLAAGAGVVAVAGMTAAGVAHASPEQVQEQISKLAGGADVTDGKVTVTVPQIAENGNTVPIEVDAPGAEAVMLLAAGNPSPDVCTFNFGPLAGSQAASTRIRLAGEQDVIAIARMPDGTFKQARQNVRVTIGGCGG